jgi:hypothetical protein
MSTIPIQPQTNIVPFLAILKPNVRFHAAVEMTVQRMKYGEATFNVMVKDGVVDNKTFSVIVRKRIKY